MSSPYFYIIRHTPSKILYAGAKWKKGCDKNNFMKDCGYQTSCKTIQNLIQKDGLESFEILFIKETKNAYEYETNFLKEHNCKDSKFWFNQHNNEKCHWHDPISKAAIQRIFGVENISMHPDIKLKKKLASIKNFNVECVLQSEYVKEKIKETNIKNLGVAYPMQSQVCLDKRVTTYKEKLGVDNPMQSLEIQNLRKERCFEKLGVNHHNQTEENKIQMKERALLARKNDPLLECSICKKIIKGKGPFSRHFKKCSNIIDSPS